MNRANNEKEIIVRVFQLSNALQTYMDKFLKQDNVTAKQFYMMIIIGTFEYNPKLGEIAERFGTSRQNVKQVLLKLEKSGYVSLHKDKDDSRILRVITTEKAKVFWDTRDNEDQRRITQIFSILTDSELDTFVSALIKTSNQVKEVST